MKRAMRVIAKDETRHAALAWEIASWASRHLDFEGREQARTAATEAIRQLEIETARDSLDADCLRATGLPNAATCRSLIAHLQRELWNA